MLHFSHISSFPFIVLSSWKRFDDPKYLKNRWTYVKDQAWASDMAASRGVPQIDKSGHTTTADNWDFDLHVDFDVRILYVYK